MANRIVPVETEVKVMNECLRLADVEEVAARDGVSPGAVHCRFNHKLKPALNDILVNEPSPKSQSSFRKVGVHRARAVAHAAQALPAAGVAGPSVMAGSERNPGGEV